MSFLDTVRRAKAYLEEQGRVSLRGLRREFELDDEALDELVEELVDVQQVAAREGKVLSWIGSASPSPVAEAQAATTVSSEPAIAPRAADAERRQLTVMFCDLVGATALSERIDAEDLREVVSAYQDAAARVIEGLDGQIAQFLGDGILVYFGYPHAHEDDPIRAATAALRILEELGPLNARLSESLPALREHPVQVRIGMHTGPVVVGGTGGGERREQLAMGDTVNIAARLEAIAEPDSAAMSDATRRLVRGAFVLEDLGEKALKGIAEPVQAFRVLRTTSLQSGFEAATVQTPLVGREQEVALLLDRWQEASQGHGQAVMLSGEAGMGKSRLVEFLRERVAERSHTWLEVRGSPFHQNSPFHPVIELLQRALGLTPEDPPGERTARLERQLSVDGLAVPEVLPLFARLLSLPLPAEHSSPTLSPEAERRRMLEALCTWIFGLAERQPLVLVVEDLHWIDPSTLELLGMLTDQAPTGPVFLLYTFRPSFESSWPTRSHVVQLPLQPLTRGQMEALVGNVAGGKSLPAEVVDQIVARTDRVPLFVEELTKTVLESGLLVEKQDCYELAGKLRELEIPPTLQDSLMARLDRLGPGKEVAQLCAALGREFSHELLEAVAPMGSDDLARVLAGLGGAELLHQRGMPPRAVYYFKHALIQEMAYQSLLKKTRRGYHERIARTLEERFPERVEAEPEAIARHYEEAGLVGEAIAAYRRAGEGARERSANSEAIHHLKKAIGLCLALPEGRERDQQEFELQVALGAPLGLAKGWGSPEVSEPYERARELCERLGESSQSAFALAGLVRFYTTRAQLDAADELGQQLLRLAESSGDEDLLLAARYQLGYILYLQGRPASALAQLDAAIDLYDPARHRHFAYIGGEDPGVNARLWAAWASWVQGFPDRALERIHEAVTLAREHAEPVELAYALAWGCVVHFMRRERELARELSDEAVEIAEAQGLPIFLGVGRLIGIWARLDSRLSRAEQDAGLERLQLVLLALGGTGTEAAGPEIVGGLAQAALEFDRPELAIEFSDGALAMSERTSQPFKDADLLRIKGESLLRQEVPAPGEAEQLLRQALEVARGQEARSFELRAATALARLLSQQGETAEARDLLQPVHDWFTEGFDTQDLKDARALLTRLE